MSHCCQPLLILQRIIYITLLPVLETQQLKVLPEVTVYLRRDATLPCEFIQKPSKANVTQVQWEFRRPEEKNATMIIVFNIVFGANIPESPLKDRVGIKELSLIIRDVEMTDAGLYTCSIATFPSGSFEGGTRLIVQEHMPVSSGVVSAVVFAVVLLVGILAAIVYLFFIRRCSLVRHHVDTDTSGLVMEAARQSVTTREEDVVYSDVNFKPSRNATPSSSHTDTNIADVTYAEVVVLHQHSQ